MMYLRITIKCMCKMRVQNEFSRVVDFVVAALNNLTSSRNASIPCKQRGRTGRVSTSITRGIHSTGCTGACRYPGPPITCDRCGAVVSTTRGPQSPASRAWTTRSISSSLNANSGRTCGKIVLRSSCFSWRTLSHVWFRWLQSFRHTH